MLTKAEARKIALSLEGAEERPYFNKPSVFVGEDFITRVHDKESAMVLPVAGIEMRDMMLEAEPELFYITAHYRNFPVLLARLSALDRKTLKDLLAARLLRVAQKSAARKKPAKRKNKTVRR
jgi:hypothetical protein